jgi:hypothetical protein
VLESVHIRGHLRRLDAAAELEAKRKKEAETARLRDKAGGWPARERNLLDELAAVQEGAERHQQRLDDERAFLRVRELRQALTLGRREAVSAAQSLGIAEPSAPEVEEALVI